MRARARWDVSSLLLWVLAAVLAAVMVWLETHSSSPSTPTIEARPSPAPSNAVERENWIEIEAMEP